VETSAQKWWPDSERALVLAGPSWLVDRLACESGHVLLARAGGNREVTIDDLTVVGCPTLDCPDCADLIVHDLISGGWCYVGTRCHPGLPPHRWAHLTIALDHGINPNAAVDLARIGM
jgi:hypothetical protein